MQSNADEITCRTVIRNGRYWWIYSDGTERPAISGGDDGGDTSAGKSDKGDNGDEDDDDLDDDDDDKGDDDDEDDDSGKGKGDKSESDEVAKWKALARKHEREVKRLRREVMNDHEKAIEDAREEGRKAALVEVGGRLVEAEIRAQAAGRMKPDALRTLLDGLNVERFLDDDGDVDRKAVRRFVNGIVGKGAASIDVDDDDGDDDEDTKPKPRKRPDMGQGKRPGKTKPSVAAGRDLYAERHKRKDK